MDKMGFSYEMNMLLSCRESPTLSLLEEWERVLGERRERSHKGREKVREAKCPQVHAGVKLNGRKRGGREGM